MLAQISNSLPSKNKKGNNISIITGLFGFFFLLGCGFLGYNNGQYNQSNTNIIIKGVLKLAEVKLN